MSHITSHHYNELIKTIEGLKVELYVANTNRKKETLRADLLQKDLDDIDDFNAECEVARMNSLNRNRHEIN